jgi:hypothetical protein
MHTSAYVSIRQHTSADTSPSVSMTRAGAKRERASFDTAEQLPRRTLCCVPGRDPASSSEARRNTRGGPGGAYVSIRQHTSAYVSIRQNTSAYVSIRQHTSAYVSIRQHTSDTSDTSAYISIRHHTSAYVSIRQHTSAYVSIRQHTQAPVVGAVRGRTANGMLSTAFVGGRVCTGASA